MASPGTILVVGDSLSAAYQMPQKAGWVNLLQEKLGSRRIIINASISGETTAGARHSLSGLLTRHQPGIVVLAIGANDGLRGHTPGAIENNLRAMVRAAQKSGASVLLVGMGIPANYGPAYRKAFQRVYSDLAETLSVTLLPSLFDDIFLRPGLLQADGIHPNQKAQLLICDTILQALQPLLQ